jgi:glycosyltransferase involved in cell wall biosynthesis
MQSRLVNSIVRLPRRTYDSAGRRVRRLGKSLVKLPHKIIVRNHWMQLGQLNHYHPRTLQREKFPIQSAPESSLPSIALVTPSYQQAAFLPMTLSSVLDQNYPRLCYVVQDGGSKDGTVQVLEKLGHRLNGWVSERDRGQADAVCRGFGKVEGDIMAWLNSDDMLMPDSLRFIGGYFATHPDVDAVYGHRVLIDEVNREIGRWVLPPHHPDWLRYVDYVPQETLFWRRSLYEKVGGVNPDFHFALDWDLLLRFQNAGARIVRLPYFIGCFRVHPQQKTSAQINSRGMAEMDQLREKEHGRTITAQEIDAIAHRLQIRANLTARLMAVGIRR